MSKDHLLEGVIAAAPNRRSFLNKIALAGAAGAAIAAGSRIGLAQTAAPTDADILNFALNLEYLEAEFYTVATTGKTIEQNGVGVTGSGQSGPTNGGQMVNFTNPVFATSDIANQIAADERAHVNLIRGALTAAGATPIAKPAINLNALGIGFGGYMDFLQLARAFEDVGVTAYAGAAPLITDKTVLAAAARIAQVEAEHASNIRLQVAKLGIPTLPLDGADVLPPPSGQKYFSVDSNGLTLTRTPGQVLYIVYGNSANATSGGFFPAGVNGTLNMSSDGVSFKNQTVALVAPIPTPITSSSFVVDATSSTSANNGPLTYFYSYVSGNGGLQPAILQSANNPKATIQFVMGPGTYNLLLTVMDATGKTSSTPITLVYKPS